MKKFLNSLLVILSIFFINMGNIVLAEAEQDKIELIERYLKKYKKNLKTIAVKYKIKDEKFDENIKSFDSLLNLIWKLKENKKLSENKEKIEKYLNKNIKELNNKSKEILKTWKIQHEKDMKKLQENLLKSGKLISSKLELLINYINKVKLNKTTLNLKESLLKANLIRLKEKSKLFSDFWKENFYNQDDMKNAFKKIINETKKDIIELKNKLKEDY